MDPLLIDADDKHRAQAASLHAPSLRRLLRYTWPHRRLLAIGMAASVVYGALHSVGILGIFPVLTILISPEGFHGRVYRDVAEDRLGASIVASFDYDDAQVKVTSVALVRIKSSALRRAIGNQPVQLLRAADQSADSVRVFQAIATAGDTITLVYQPNSGGDTRTATVRLRPLSFGRKMLVALARWIPQAHTASERVWTLVYVLAGVVILVVISNAARFVAQYFVASGVLRGVMDLRRTL